MGDLFAAAAAGDPRAVAELHQRLRAFARQICRGGGPHPETAIDWEDVAQEAARKLLATGLAQYTGAGSENSYMYSLVKTTVIQIARSARRRRRREEASVTGVLPMEDSVPQGSRLDVQRILAELDADCREVIRRALFREESYADLARSLGLAESSVRARLSRCLKKARLVALGGVPG